MYVRTGESRMNGLGDSGLGFNLFKHIAKNWTAKSIAKKVVPKIVGVFNPAAGAALKMAASGISTKKPKGPVAVAHAPSTPDSAPETYYQAEDGSYQPMADKPPATLDTKTVLIGLGVIGLVGMVLASRR